MNRPPLAGIALLAFALAGIAVAPRTALACWLAAWWWALGVVLGTFANGWIHALTGGEWGRPVRATAALLSMRMPWLLPGLVVVALGLRELYPWATMSGEAWQHLARRPAFARAWLSPAFFAARLLAYAVAWWLLARPATLAARRRAAVSLIAYALVTTLAAIDLLMSLLPGWSSTAFGLVAMGAQALCGAAAVVLLGLPRESVVPTESRVPLSRDLGNLLLMWCMSWAYLAFMQFLIVWSENLPREIAWYLPRLQTGWRWDGAALAVLLFAVPFTALLFRPVKDRPGRLRAVAVLVLAAGALDAAWLVLPSVAPHDPHAWWLAPLAFAGMALVLFGSPRHDDAIARGVHA